jgi:hypothetical protein
MADLLRIINGITRTRLCFESESGTYYTVPAGAWGIETVGTGGRCTAEDRITHAAAGVKGGRVVVALVFVLVFVGACKGVGNGREGRVSDHSWWSGHETDR